MTALGQPLRKMRNLKPCNLRLLSLSFFIQVSLLFSQVCFPFWYSLSVESLKWMWASQISVVEDLLTFTGQRLRHLNFQASATTEATPGCHIVPNVPCLSFRYKGFSTSSIFYFVLSSCSFSSAPPPSSLLVFALHTNNISRMKSSNYKIMCASILIGHTREYLQNPP